MVGAVLQRLFSDLQPRQREEKWLGLEQCLSALTGPVRRRAANICLGMTPLPPNSGRIPPLKSIVPMLVRSCGVLDVAQWVLARESGMNWDQIEINWLHFKNRLRHNWVKLTDEDITRISGRRDELVARLQDRYGFARAEAEREVGAWMRSQRHAMPESAAAQA